MKKITSTHEPILRMKSHKLKETFQMLKNKACTGKKSALT